MNISEVKTSGEFKLIQELHVKDNGEWKQAKEGWVKSEGEWKQFLDVTPTPLLKPVYYWSGYPSGALLTPTLTVDQFPLAKKIVGMPKNGCTFALLTHDNVMYYKLATDTTFRTIDNVTDISGDWQTLTYIDTSKNLYIAGYRANYIGVPAAESNGWALFNTNVYMVSTNARGTMAAIGGTTVNKLQACGVNTNGQLGNGTASHNATAYGWGSMNLGEATSSSEIYDMSMGWFGSIILVTDGVYISGSYIPIGASTLVDVTSWRNITADLAHPGMPPPSSGIKELVREVDQGTYCKLTNYGALFWCGENSRRAIGGSGSGGVGDSGSITLSTNITSIGKTNSDLFLLGEDGKVYAAGPNTNGALGDGSTTPRSTMTPISGLTNVNVLSVNGLSCM